MPDTKLADQIHSEKYRAPGESFREWASRVASALKDDAVHFHAFRDGLLEQRVLPAGRVQAAAGSPRHVTALNCYVAPTIKDSFTKGDNSIMGVAAKAAQTMRMGGGIGYDFSTLRPRGSPIKTLGSQSSGPVAFMDIFDSVCRVTSSAGNRRGAQMGVMRVDHPDIEEFIRAKQNKTNLRGFNVSVAVTNEFMACVRDGRDFPLRWGGKEWDTINAQALWEEIMRSTWDWAEPGVIFIDRVNTMNNLWYCETIAATNPCGEQPLPPNGACLLGSFNLVKYVTPEKEIAWDLLHHDISVFVRGMDNVLDRTKFPLVEQEEEAKNKRRMGLGVTGLANAVEFISGQYGSDAFLDMTGRIMAFIRDGVYLESSNLAHEKGSFPEFDKDKYLAGEFIKTLPGKIRDSIANNGIRNSHLTSVAPNGTISQAADNVSSGIEPVFSRYVERDIKTNQGDEKWFLEDYGARIFGTRAKYAQECSLDEHINTLATVQQYVDSAVSKTNNVDPSTPWEQFKNVYQRAWELGCKGVTTYTPPHPDGSGGQREGILTAVDGPACYVDPKTGLKTCDE